MLGKALALLALLLGASWALALLVGWPLVVAGAAGGAAALYVAARRMWPTHERLQKDLKRLDLIIPKLDEYKQAKYQNSDVQAYYSSTTFRDYKLLELATGCNAMHTELVPAQPLPFRCGHLQQLLYVIAEMGPGSGSSSSTRVLEVGFGKGSNSIFLASLFKHSQFIGVDLTEDHVQYARSHASRLGLSNVRFELGDAAQPPAAIGEGGTYDLIFGIESFCHVDTDAKLKSFLDFASKSLRPGGRIVVVDGFRSRDFASKPEDVQQAMNLAESGFRICRMAPKATWRSLGSAAGFEVVQDVDLTDHAVRFWVKGWRVAQILMLLVPSFLRYYFQSSPIRAETGANFVSVVMTAYAMALGSAEYGVLVLRKK